MLWWKICTENSIRPLDSRTWRRGGNRTSSISSWSASSATSKRESKYPSKGMIRLLLEFITPSISRGGTENSSKLIKLIWPCLTESLIPSQPSSSKTRSSFLTGRCQSSKNFLGPIGTVSRTWSTSENLILAKIWASTNQSNRSRLARPTLLKRTWILVPAIINLGLQRFSVS
jgi:hypothetical protein